MASAFDLTPAYAELRARNNLQHDDQQLRALAQLQEFGAKLLVKPAWFARKGLQVPGAYMHGGVGCGKTMLMDLLFASLPIAEKQRWHFLHFMRRVHQGLQQFRGNNDPLSRVVDSLAPLRLLAVDEFYVEDIADAMILGRLLERLAARRISLIVTSNCAPNQLYPNGLQRKRFLPAIARLQSFEQISFQRTTDYRSLRLSSHQRLLVPNDDAAHQQLQRFFRDYAGNSAEVGTLTVHGRAIRYLGRYRELIWFDFTDICESARASMDYLELAANFTAFIVSDVPVFDGSLASDNAARRFIALVDALYDEGKTLILSAATEPQRLYQGHNLAAIFARTSSRIIEMTAVDSELESSAST